MRFGGANPLNDMARRSRLRVQKRLSELEAAVPDDCPPREYAPATEEEVEAVVAALRAAMGEDEWEEWLGIAVSR